MTDSWMYPRVTDYWDEQVGAINSGARRLAALSPADRSRALGEIQAAVTEHARVLPDDVIAQAAVAFADDLYKAAAAIDRWDDALDAYLTASAATMSGQLAERGFHLQYIADNAWGDLTKPLQLLPHWYQAAGFVYVCPAAVALQIAAHDGLDPNADGRAVLARYGSEARDVVSKIVARCHEERRPVMQLDTDSTDHSFDTALALRREPGVITVFRNQAPEPGTQVAAWLPQGEG